LANLFTGTAGIKLQVALGINISGPGVAKIRALAPDGVVKEFAAIIDNAIVGSIFYVTLPGDLHVAGTWKINGIWDPAGVNYFVGKTVCIQILDPGEC